MLFSDRLQNDPNHYEDGLYARLLWGKVTISSTIISAPEALIGESPCGTKVMLHVSDLGHFAAGRRRLLLFPERDV